MKKKYLSPDMVTVDLGGRLMDSLPNDSSKSIATPKSKSYIQKTQSSAPWSTSLKDSWTK